MKRREFIFSGLGVVATIFGACDSSSQTSSTGQNTGKTFNQLPRPADISLSFIAIGDVGTGRQGQYQVAQAMDSYWQVAPYPMVLMLGDNIYNNGEIKKINQAFEQPYRSLLAKDIKFRAVLGNHDVRRNRGNDQVLYAGYNMPDRYYTFTQGAVQFFALDTTQAYLAVNNRRRLWGTQLTWLETELSRSTAPWKIVFGHHPIYSSGRHGSDLELAKELQPLFSQYGVQLYLNGHDHHYERTAVIDKTTYITSGNGAKLRSVGQSKWTAHASSQLGFTTFDVRPDRIQVRAIGPDGHIFDEAEIVDIG